MRGIAIAACGIILCAAVPALAQDDYEYGKSLAESGYFDLAEKVWQSLISNSKASDKEKKRAEYGLKNVITLQRALAVRDAQGRADKLDAAIDSIKSYVSSVSDFQFKVDAQIDLAKALQKKGEALMELAQKNPSLSGKAKSAFEDGYAVAKGMVDNMRDELSKNSSEDLALLLVRGFYGYSEIAASYVDVLVNFDLAQSERVLADITKLYKEDLAWDLSGYVKFMESTIYIGKMHYSLSKYYDATGNGKKASENWSRAIDNIKAARALASSDENIEKFYSVVDATLLSLYTEFGIYWEKFGGDVTNKDAVAQASKLGQEADKLVSKIERFHPDMVRDPALVAVKLETGKAFLIGSNAERGKAMLTKIIDMFPRTAWEVKAQEILATYATNLPMDIKMKMADTTYSQGQYFSAIQQYNNILRRLTPQEKDQHYGKLINNLASCYFEIWRFIEANYLYAIISDAKYKNESWFKDALKNRLECLERLNAITKDPNIDRELQSFTSFVTQYAPDIVQSGQKRTQAVKLMKDGKFKEALAVWEDIAKASGNSAGGLEALWGIGACYFKMKEAAEKQNQDSKDLTKKSVDAFRKHVDAAMGIPELPKGTLKDILTSFYTLIKTYLKDFQLLDMTEDKAAEEVISYTSKVEEKLGKEIEASSNDIKQNVVRILAKKATAQALTGKFVEAVKTLDDSFKAFNQFVNYKTEVSNAGKTIYKKLKENENLNSDMPRYIVKVKNIINILDPSDLGDSATGTEDQDTLFESAMRDMATGDIKNAKDKMKDSLTGYESAMKKLKDPNARMHCRLRIIECNMYAASVDTALKMIEEWKKDMDRGGTIDMKVLELYARVLFEKGKASQGNEKRESIAKAGNLLSERILPYFSKQYMTAEDPDEKAAKQKRFMMNLWQYYLVLSESESPDYVITQYKRDEATGIAPDFDSKGANEFAPKILQIYKDALDKSPKK